MLKHASTGRSERMNPQPQLYLHPTPISLHTLLTEAGIPAPTAAACVTVGGIASDSRRVRPGDLFVAIRGLHTDARAYIADAYRRGAVAVVAEADEAENGAPTPPTDVADLTAPTNRPSEPTGEAPPTVSPLLITVPNARVAMACLYDAWFGHPTRYLRMVGVTGTNGKTSVASMLHHILRTAGLPCGLIGTVGCLTTGGDAAICRRDGEMYSGMTTPDPVELYALLAQMVADATPGVREMVGTPTATASEGAGADGGADMGAMPNGSPTATVPLPTGTKKGKAPPPEPVATVIMEVTSHALLFGKVAPLTFDLAVFTNLSSEHLDLHGTMEDYYAAKRRLFSVASQVVVNADDRWGRRLLAEPLPVRHWHICHATGPDSLPPDRMCPAGDGHCTRLYAEQVKQLGEDGVAFKLTSPDVRLRLRCPVPGQFTVMNALEAAAAALALGVSPAAVRDGLASFGGVPGRMERVVSATPTVPFTVFIDFAHTPDALEKLLGTVHRFRYRNQRIVLVFGCGGDRDRSKRKVMARIASRMADSVVITSDNSRTEDPGNIISDILAGMDKESEFAVVPDRAEAIQYAIRHARVGDIILLAGKGHENYEIDRRGKHPFCERAIAEAAVERFWGKDARASEQNGDGSESKE